MKLRELEITLSHDEIFKYLKVWQDKNGNGWTDEGELISLSDLGIKAIYLNENKNKSGRESDNRGRDS